MANISMKEFVQIVKNHFTDKQIYTIVEVGALDGKDSVYFKVFFPNAHVIAFEGLKENWEFHKPNDVLWLNSVIAAHDGEITYHVKYFNKEMSTGIHGIYDRGQKYGTEIRVVPCYRLDSLVKIPIDMMKIDVEGASWDILEGMGNLLNTLKILHIETETEEFFIGQKMLHDDVCKYLKDRGFKCLKLAAAKIESGIQYDSVWINEKYLDS